MCLFRIHFSYQQRFSHSFTISLSFRGYLISRISSRLNDNQLSGTIPDSIGNLVNLQLLYVSLSFFHINLFSHLFPALVIILMYSTSFQPFEFQPTEWNHPRLDREPCQTVSIVCVW